MKKTLERIRHYSFIFSMCLFLFNILSCGIDSIVVLDAPENNKNEPLSSNITDYAQRYFLFYTNENNASAYGSNVRFLGTEVYYKIYSDESTMSSESNNLKTLANDTSTSANSASRMIETYGYKALKVTGQKNMTLIPAKGKNQLVYIRLTDYQNDEPYSSRILLGGENGSNLYGSEEAHKPIRNIDDKELTFNFGRHVKDSEKNKIPVSEDEDVKMTSSTNDGKWYVAMFAVAVANDETYQKIFSNILYLGAVTIDQNQEDN